MNDRLPKSYTPAEEENAYLVDGDDEMLLTYNRGKSRQKIWNKE